MEPIQKSKIDNEAQNESKPETVEVKPADTVTAPAPKKTGFWDKMKTAVTKAVDCCLE